MTARSIERKVGKMFLPEFIVLIPLCSSRIYRHAHRCGIFQPRGRTLDAIYFFDDSAMMLRVNIWFYRSFCTMLIFQIGLYALLMMHLLRISLFFLIFTGLFSPDSPAEAN